MEIPRIIVRNLDIPPVPDYLMTPNVYIPSAPPVTVHMGVPIVDMPGCVEAHEANNSNSNLIQDDRRGTLTYCDGSVPSYNPIEYSPEDLTYSDPAEVKPIKTDTPTDDIPSDLVPEIPPIPPVPPEEKEVVVEVPPPEPEVPSWVETYLPAPEAATTTAAIAVVATTSALLAKPLADLLLKVIKPTIKKVIKKISTLRGKKVKIDSLRERQGQQRTRNKAIRILKGRE
jgi:hypothetical protein